MHQPPNHPHVQRLMRRARYAYWRSCTAPCVRLRKPWDRALRLYEAAIVRLIGTELYEYPYHNSSAQQALRLGLPAIPTICKE